MAVPARKTVALMDGCFGWIRIVWCLPENKDRNTVSGTVDDHYSREKLLRASGSPAHMMVTAYDRGWELKSLTINKSTAAGCRQFTKCRPFSLKINSVQEDTA